MQESNATPSNVRIRGGFSLASLALFVTACAVFLTAIDVERCRRQLGQMWVNDSGMVVTMFVAAAIVGGVVGLARLLVSGFSWRMLVFAPLTGGLVGAAAVLILIAPGPLWRSLVAVGLLLATTNFLRLGAE
jgi:hypothetical protein